MISYYKDLGYEIKKYFTGKNKETYNLHFRGEYISSHESEKECYLSAIFHDDKRTVNILNTN